MYECIEFAGFASAQVVCCLFDRIPFVPLAFSRRAPDRKSVSILPCGSAEQIAATGQQWLDANLEDADQAVLATDGYVTLPPGERRDAIISTSARIVRMRSGCGWRCPTGLTTIPPALPFIDRSSSSPRWRGRMPAG